MSERPIRVQRKRTKGWRMPKGAVYVGRLSKWGNPFTIDACEEWRRVDDTPTNGETPRETAVRFYREWLAETPRESLRAAARAELRGKKLCCWCPLGLACHADVLLEIANV